MGKKSSYDDEEYEGVLIDDADWFWDYFDMDEADLDDLLWRIEDDDGETYNFEYEIEEDRNDDDAETIFGF